MDNKMVDKLTFCTVITRSYIKYANALYTSIKETHNNFSFYALVIDATHSDDSEIMEKLQFEVIYLDELNIKNIADMKIYYDAFELCNAARPSMIKYLMQKKEADKVIYLDADIFVNSEFIEVSQKLDTFLFCFTPHVTVPLPLDGKLPNDILITDSGVFNSGFWAFRKNEKSFEILDWLISRLELYCFNDIKNKMFVDQKLLPMVTTLFKDYFYCFDNPAYNIAYWNLHERQIEYYNNEFYINNKKVAFFHLSGFNENYPDILTKFDHRVTLKEIPIFGKVIDKYLIYLKNAYQPSGDLSYRYVKINGMILTPFSRRYYFRKRTFQHFTLERFRYRLSRIFGRLQSIIYTE